MRLSLSSPFSERNSTVDRGPMDDLIQVNANATAATIVFVAVILGAFRRRYRDR
jgi:hypothetical protein